MMLKIALPLAAPPFRVDRLRGQIQAERDEAEVVDEVRGVDDAFREVIEVVDDRQVVRRRLSTIRPDERWRSS